MTRGGRGPMRARLLPDDEIGRTAAIEVLRAGGLVAMSTDTVSGADLGCADHERFWPGGLTLVLPQAPEARLPAELTGGAATIGVRIPDHESPRALARALGPLPVTSANLSGQSDARAASEVLAQLGSRIDLVLDGGPARGGVPSTVVDCSGELPRILRAGAISTADLAAAVAAAGLTHAF